MFGSGRTIGTIIIIGGLLVACGGSTLAVVSVSADSNGTTGGVVLGVVLSLLIAAPLLGGGSVLFWRGRKELAELDRIQKQKGILNMIKAQGQVDISEVVLELDIDIDEVKSLVYDLVGKSLFHGYINWDDGTLYSKQVSTLQGSATCPNCGGEQEFVGKGIVQCRHCGAQVFL